MISKETQKAIYRTAEYCAHDLPYSDAQDRELLAELALDADRLPPKSNQEIGDLVKKHSYSAVMKEAMKYVPSY